MAGWSLFSWLRQLFHLTFCLCLQGSSRYLEENRQMQINIAQKWTKRNTVCSLCLWSHTNACDAIVYTKQGIMIACLFSWNLRSSQSYCWGFWECLVHFFLLVKSFVYGNLTGWTSAPARSEILWPTVINTHVGSSISSQFLIGQWKWDHDHVYHKSTRSVEKKWWTIMS